ncbi:MAG: DNA repair protein RecN [Lachnospiraceae bacterium]|nr:DNA repair protein RecN [Lachnospiraceae bacterium]
MLESLHVKNMALIKDAELELKSGLNVLSGETGAGKSLLLGSVDLALGKRADPDLIRNGESAAYVELVFSLPEPGLEEKVREMGMEPEEGRLIISRRITEGRSVSRVNGETVTLTNLKKLTELLIDIHGQHDHQSLLKEENHLKVLDAFEKDLLQEAKEAYEASYLKYRAFREKIREMGDDPESRKRQLDFLDFQIREIEEASLKSGEEEELDRLYRKLNSREMVKNALEQILENLREEVSSKISECIRLSREAAEADEEIKPLLTQLYDIDALTEDAGREASHLLENADVDEEQLKAVEDRLSLIIGLKKKYGGSVEQILKNLKAYRKEYDELYDFDVNAEKILQELEKEKVILVEKAAALHEKRLEAAESFSCAMEEALRDLNFLHVAFRVQVQETTRFTRSGADEVRFLISTNPGEEPRPLSRVASGGELSRIMLAIKSISADADDIPVLIFDEIDQGISGRTAAAVARKMQKIAEDHQVICISHLPQIVASADDNFLIEKSVEDGETITRLAALSYEDSIREIARLSGSGEITDSNLRNAAEMKENLRRKP